MIQNRITLIIGVGNTWIIVQYLYSKAVYEEYTNRKSIRRVNVIITHAGLSCFCFDCDFNAYEYEYKYNDFVFYD